MALTLVLAFAVLFSFVSCEAEPENCTQCKLLPAGEGFATEFRRKASEKGVRLVYLKLKIGNDSYHPLELQDEFLSNRWVWANAISEPMLSLSYDYDILSLGLLTYQVRKMDVQLEDQPSGCLANLNSSCQDKVVARVLLNETEHVSGELLHEAEVVCVAAIEENNDFYSGFFDGNVAYHCCRKSDQGSTQESSMECELVVKSSGWFKAFYGILNFLTVAMMFFCPAFLLALPDFIFNFQEEDQEQSQDQDNTREDSQLIPQTSRYGSINQGLGTNGDSESDPLQRNNETILSHVILRIFSDGNSNTSSVEDSQQNHRTGENNSVNQSKRLVYLDDASPIACSTFFGKYAEHFTGLVPFNIKLAFLCYCVIPIFVYIKLGLNYTLKREFFEEASNKQQAFLVGPLFAFLFTVRSFFSITIAILPLIIIFFSSPEDFMLTVRCPVCHENRSSAGEDMLKHIKQLQLKVYSFGSCIIELHKECITKPIKCCTHLCLTKMKPPNKRLKRALIVFWVLLCYAVFVTISGVIFGVIFFCIFLVGLGLRSIYYSPLITIYATLIRKGIQVFFFFLEWLIEKREHSSLLGRHCIFIFLLIIASFGIALYHLFTGGILSIACIIGALSCRFIVRMFGFIIMGLVLNADVASPFVTFFVVASTNMYLCYYNLQKEYQEVKQMISQQWQKHKHLLHNKNLSNGEEGTIPENLFWHICSDKSKSKHKVLPIRPEIYRMLFNMALILIFLVLVLCSIIFLRTTYDITGVASTIAVFVSGVIPGLFFKGLTKEKTFIGVTKSGMMKKIKLAVIEYIEKVINRTGTAAWRAKRRRWSI